VRLPGPSGVDDMPAADEAIGDDRSADDLTAILPDDTAILIGCARRSLEAVDRYKEAQALGFGMFIVWPAGLIVGLVVGSLLAGFSVVAVAVVTGPAVAGAWRSGRRNSMRRCRLSPYVGGRDARPTDHGRLDRAEPLANPARIRKGERACVPCDCPWR
jgi:hypothetical protein